MKTKCYSVRLKSLIPISDKAYKAEYFDGSTDIIPSSQIFGKDFDVKKSDAYWISAWILEKKNIQYSDKKEAYFNEKKVMIPDFQVYRHIPEHKEPLKDNSIESLKR